MPQLMPLNWIVSFMFVFLLFCLMVFLYYSEEMFLVFNGSTKWIKIQVWCW